MNAVHSGYRILVVDDHDVVRRGVRALLESQSGVEACAEAANGAEALEHVKKNKTDLVVLDLTMPEMNGLDAARAIRQTSPETEVLILSMHFSEEIAREVLRVGARGYVLKSDANSELIAAVQRLRQGKPFFCHATRCLHGGYLCAWPQRLERQRFAARRTAYDPRS